jgi:hypothetical protein
VRALLMNVQLPFTNNENMKPEFHFFGARHAGIPGPRESN